MPSATGLLRQLLDCCPSHGDWQSCEILHHLLSEAPSAAVISGRRTLFDILEVSEQETAHSLFLAWLLDPHGPLTECWLLRALFEKAVPERVWPGLPGRVEAEVSESRERPDIVAFWNGFTLIIEYKIDSPETSHQVRRYLKTFQIWSTADGVVLYATKHGQWPPSIGPGDLRIRLVTYEDLVTLIDRGLSEGVEPTEKGRVLSREYRNCLAHSVNRSFGMEKPTFSEGTKLMLLHHRKFQALRDIALEESAEFVHWISREAAKRLRSVLDDDMEWHDTWEVSTQKEFIYRRPHWKHNGVEIGIGFGTEHVGQRLLPEVDFWLGVILPWPDRDEDETSRNEFSKQLHGKLVEHWPLKKLGSWEAEWPLIQYSTFEAIDDPYIWAEHVLVSLMKLAETLGPAIDKFITSVDSKTARP